MPPVQPHGPGAPGPYTHKHATIPQCPLQSHQTQGLVRVIDSATICRARARSVPAPRARCQKAKTG